MTSPAELAKVERLVIEKAMARYAIWEKDNPEGLLSFACGSMGAAWAGGFVHGGRVGDVVA